MYKLENSPRIRNIERKFRSPIKTILYNWHWKDNLKHSEIGERIGVPRPTVTRWFKQFDLPSQLCTRFTNLNLEKHRKWLQANKKPKIKKEFPWIFNKDFFKRWSVEMAYVLGFLIADGCVFINPRGSRYFTFCSKDKEIIKKIRSLLGSNHKIGIRKPKDPREKKRFVLQIGSKETFSCLGRLGVVPNKSLIIKFPKNIPAKFLRHFIRGYFDGDGCVYFGRYWPKDRNKFKWVFQVRFTSGCRQFLKELHDVLKKKYVKGGSLFKKPRGYELTFAQNDSFALFDAMYKNVSKEMFLERKYEVFKKAFRILK